MTKEVKDCCDFLIKMKESSNTKLAALLDLAEESLRMDKLLMEAYRLIDLYMRNTSNKGRAMECANWLGEYRGIK